MRSRKRSISTSKLSKVLRIYFASSRRNDFIEAHDYYDLWVFDEYHDPSDESNLSSLRYIQEISGIVLLEKATMAN